MAYEYFAAVTRVVDGDTLELMVDLGFGTHRKDRFRLLDVDTPEVYGVKKDSEEYAKGKQCSEFVDNWLRELGNYKCRVVTHKDKKGKYGRYLAEIYCGENHLNQAIREFMETL